MWPLSDVYADFAPFLVKLGLRGDESVVVFQKVCG